jgi:hypothetical protein
MESGLQKRFENMSAFEIITDLKATSGEGGVVRGFRAFILLQDGRAQQCERARSQDVWLCSTVECQIPNEIAIDRVLQSLPLAIKDLS